MENNGYNVVTTSAQEDANAAAGEPLSVKAKSYVMPGVTVDGTDPIAVYQAVGTAIERDGWGTGIDRDKAAAFVEAARRTG